MTIQERQQLEGLMREKLADHLTVSQMKTVIAALQDASADMDAFLLRAGAEDPGQDNYMQAFIQAKKTEGRTGKTLALYEYRIRRLLADLKTPAARITTLQLRQWYAAELERGVRQNTVRGCQYVYQSFFGWLFSEGLIQKDPCANIGPIKVPKLKKEPYSSVEIELIKEHSMTTRDKAIVCFLLATGCRIEEVVRLNRDDIDFHSKEIVVYGKGNKERTVYMDDVAAAMLQRYFSERRDSSPALFPGRGSDRMTDSGIRRMLKRVEKRSGVKNIHPHRFRRTLATNLARKGMPVQEIARILGHEKVTTTMTYISVEQQQVKHHYQELVA